MASGSIDQILNRMNNAGTNATIAATESQNAGTSEKMSELKAKVQQANIDAHKSTIADKQSELSPPPMKTEFSGSGKNASSRQVVDQREVSRITKELQAAESKLAGAESSMRMAMEDESVSKLLKDVASISQASSEQEKQDLANQLVAMATVKPEALERNIDKKLDQASKENNKKFDAEEKEIAKSLKDKSAEEIAGMIKDFYDPTKEITKEHKVLMKVLSGKEQDRQGN